MVNICCSIKLKIGGIFYGAKEKSIKKLDLLVIRINRDGIIGKSRPCYNCLDMMRAVGIKKVYYTSGNNNELICENVKDMISIESSTITIKLDMINTNLNTEMYFEKLLKKNIPKEIKHKNLLYFIKYNYHDVCPNWTYLLIKNNEIAFYNSNNVLIIKSIIN